MLIAVDFSENAMRAVSYAAKIVANHPEITVTVFTAVRRPGETGSLAESSTDAFEEEMKKRLALVSGLGGLLSKAGLPPERIKTKVGVFSAPQTAADEILREKHQGGYDTIVVGRRGVSKKEEFLFGSVSARVMREAGPEAVWVVA